MRQASRGGQFPANTGMTSTTSLEINFKRMEMVILGTEYARKVTYLMAVKFGLLSLPMSTKRRAMSRSSLDSPVQARPPSRRIRDDSSLVTTSTYGRIPVSSTSRAVVMPSAPTSPLKRSQRSTMLSASVQSPRTSSM